MKRIIIAVGLLLASALVLATPNSPLNESCDGFPKLPLVTQENLCVGLLVQRSKDVPIKMPRTALETPDGKLLVVDMGGWTANKGKLWLVDFRSKTPNATTLLSNLNLPHKILRAKDGKYYVGEAHRIQRFELVNNQIAHLETVVDNLPYSTEYLHPLKNFVFDRDSNLIVSVGSSSDHCNKNVSLDKCLAGEEGALRLYAYQAATGNWSSTFTLLATGLRNSMVLAVSSAGKLLQAENSIDLSASDEPLEEINIIEPKGFYGWPLCYDRNTPLDAAKGACTVKNYREPWSLMPPHVAPMDALYYHHNKLPSLNNKLIMSWHGYKIVGHRLVSYEIDDQGRPLLKKTANYWSDPLKEGEGFKTREYNANAGMVAQHSEIISHWNEVDGVRPKGAPVGISVMDDGSLLIVDDKNAAILRLSTGVAYQDKTTSQAVNTAAAVVAPEPIRKIFSNRCSKCHEPMQYNPERLLNAEHWLQKNDGRTRLEHKLFYDKVMPMPPDGSLLPDEREQLKKWVQQL